MNLSPIEFLLIVLVIAPYYMTSFQPVQILVLFTSVTVKTCGDAIYTSFVYTQVPPVVYNSRSIFDLPLYWPLVFECQALEDFFLYIVNQYTRAACTQCVGACLGVSSNISAGQILHLQFHLLPPALKMQVSSKNYYHDFPGLGVTVSHQFLVIDERNLADKTVRVWDYL